MIRKKKSSPQETMWISTAELQVAPQIKFYSKLNSVLESMNFGKLIRTLCQPYYSEKANVRPPIDPEVYFKMLLVGFFENIGSERGICARCADSLSLRHFLGYTLTESVPDHSSLSIIRNRLPESIYTQVFTIILRNLKSKGLVIGKNIAFDSSIIEANASLSGLKNRMTKETYEEYIKSLALENGVDTSDKAAVARFDRKRPDRKTSNSEWVNPHDSDAKIGKTKHGATSMVYKPEHAVDIDTGAIVSAEALPGDQSDTENLIERIIDAQIIINDISDDPTSAVSIQTVTADKGYYKLDGIKEIQEMEVLPVIPDFIDNRNLNKLDIEERIAFSFAKSEVKSEQGKAQLKRRGMYVERSFAHVLDSGGQRRTTLGGLENLNKRYRIAAAAFNLSLLMRELFGVGTPKQLLARLNLVLNSIFDLFFRFGTRFFVDFKNVFFFLFLKSFLIRNFKHDWNTGFSTGS